VGPGFEGRAAAKQIIKLTSLTGAQPQGAGDGMGPPRAAGVPVDGIPSDLLDFPFAA